MIQEFSVVTNCTARKRVVGSVARLQPTQLQGGAAKVADRWIAATSRTQAATTAGNLYLGRAMTESKAVASQLGGSLHVVSAGLGLAAQDDPAPNYDLTVASGAGSLRPALTAAGSDTADWWQELNARKGTPLPLSRLINRTKCTRFLLALPSAYVDMVRRDLEQLEDQSLDRLYIFTSRVGSNIVAARLKQCVLPYDERLEGHKNYAGTRSDFPQRAMRHFVQDLQGHFMDGERAQDAVIRALARLKKPTIPERARKSDAEIVEMLRSQWHSHAGNSARLLRYLRDTALVACEQSRFGGLWRKVRAEIQ